VLAEAEKRALLAVFERTKGNKTQAAAILGIPLTKLHTRLKRFGLAPESAV
jgi:DNA-binding protein Fis